MVVGLQERKESDRRMAQAFSKKQGSEPGKAAAPVIHGFFTKVQQQVALQRCASCCGYAVVPTRCALCRQESSDTDASDQKQLMLPNFTKIGHIQQLSASPANSTPFVRSATATITGFDGVCHTLKVKADNRCAPSSSGRFVFVSIMLQKPA